MDTIEIFRSYFDVFQKNRRLIGKRRNILLIFGRQSKHENMTLLSVFPLNSSMTFHMLEMRRSVMQFVYSMASSFATCSSSAFNVSCFDVYFLFSCLFPLFNSPVLTLPMPLFVILLRDMFVFLRLGCCLRRIILFV